MRPVRYEVPAITSVWGEDEHQQFSLVTADGMPWQREQRVRRRVEVFGVSPTIVTRARIAYEVHSIVERRGVQARRQPSPIEGKRYTLDAQPDGTVVITGDGGVAVSADEEAAVRAEEQRFGRPETLAMVIARLDVTPGEPVTIPPRTASRLMGGELQVDTMVVTFVEVAGDHAVFTLRLALRGGRGGIDTRADAAGTLRLDVATARPIELRVVGPVHLTGALIADGTLELVSARTAA